MRMWIQTHTIFSVKLESQRVETDWKCWNRWKNLNNWVNRQQNSHAIGSTKRLTQSIQIRLMWLAQCTVCFDDRCVFSASAKALSVRKLYIVQPKWIQNLGHLTIAMNHNMWSKFIDSSYQKPTTMPLHFNVIDFFCQIFSNIFIHNQSITQSVQSRSDHTIRVSSVFFAC